MLLNDLILGLNSIGWMEPRVNQPVNLVTTDLPGKRKWQLLFLEHCCVTCWVCYRESTGNAPPLQLFLSVWAHSPSPQLLCMDFFLIDHVMDTTSSQGISMPLHPPLFWRQGVVERHIEWVYVCVLTKS